MNIDGIQEIRLLHIVYPIDFSIDEDRHDGKKIRILMNDFEIVPFSTETHSIEYMDHPLFIRKNKEGSGYIMTCIDYLNN